MRILVAAAIITATISTAHARCEDVGNVLEVRINQGTTVIETSDGFYGFSKMLAVGKSNDRGRACYDEKRNVLCFPTSTGKRCEKVQ